MKHLIGSIVAILFCVQLVAQDKPDWVLQHPAGEMGFVGIGMCEMSDADYQQKAKQRALADLVSSIKVDVSANSLLNTLEDNGAVRQTFAEDIRMEARAEIEKFRLVDSWQDGTEYWVYYELNYFDYEEYMEARRQKAIKDGFDYWYRGNALLEQGDFMSGVDLLTKAMSTIRPVLNMELLCSYEGNTINLGTEIYASLTSIFNGVTVVVNPTAVAGTPFKGIADPIAVGVYRNGNPLKNVRLQAKFVSGSGDVSEMAPTDETGVAALYIRNITSKQVQQQVQVSVATDALEAFQEGENAALFKNIFSTLPAATLTINLTQKQLSAYVKTVQSDINALARNVKSMLTNNFFNVMESPAGADVTVTLDNTFQKGRVVPGELQNFVEYFSALGIQITNNHTGEIVLNYSLNDIRTLVPEKKSVAQAKSMAARDLMKRLNRDFDKELKKITIDVGGELPAAPSAPSVTVPTVEIPQSPVTPQPVQPVQPNPVPDIRGELTDGVWVAFSKITHMGDKSRIHFLITNKNEDDFQLKLYRLGQTVVNEEGEEMSVSNMRIGSKSETYSVQALIVPNLPTEMVIEVKKLKSVALFGMKDAAGHSLKLRNLK